MRPGIRLCLVASALLPFFTPLSPALNGAEARPARVLIFTKSSGFQHPIIKRYQGPEELSAGEKIMVDLARQAGLEAVCTKDGTAINAENLARFAAVVFYTSGDLCTVAKPAKDGKEDRGPAVSPEGKAALIEAVRQGLGFVGIHSAADTWHTHTGLPGKEDRYRAYGKRADPYVRMLGGEFIAHDKHQPGTMLVVDERFPGMAFGPNPVRVTCNQEWYSFKDFSPDLHVLIVLDTKGLVGPHYERPPYPLSWARLHGRGRVFYTGLGHGRDDWDSPAFHSHLIGALRWATGQVDADLTPNLKAVAPEHAVIPLSPRTRKANAR